MTRLLRPLALLLLIFAAGVLAIYLDQTRPSITASAAPSLETPTTPGSPSENDPYQTLE